VDGPGSVVIDHNTIFQTNNIAVQTRAYPLNSYVSAVWPAPGFVFTNNIANGYGFTGDSTADGLPTLSTYYTGYVFARNVLVGGNPSQYPAGNFFPSSLAQAGFVNYAGGNYRLAASSPYKNAGTDGKDIGADIDSIFAATSSGWRITPRP
jgi:hypothetical protein